MNSLESIDRGTDFLDNFDTKTDLIVNVNPFFVKTNEPKKKTQKRKKVLNRIIKER